MADHNPWATPQDSQNQQNPAPVQYDQYQPYQGERPDSQHQQGLPPSHPQYEPLGQHPLGQHPPGQHPTGQHPESQHPQGHLLESEPQQGQPPSQQYQPLQGQQPQSQHPQGQPPQYQPSQTQYQPPETHYQPPGPQYQQPQTQPPLPPRNPNPTYTFPPDEGDRAEQVETLQSYEATAPAATEDDTNQATLQKEFPGMDSALIAAIYNDSKNLGATREMLHALGDSEAEGQGGTK